MTLMAPPQRCVEIRVSGGRENVQNNINLEHPDYRAKKAMWRKYKDLYTGGEQLKSRAAEYLMQRQKEGYDVYTERLQRVFYENYIGSIIDWYSATLFRREPVLHLDGPDDRARSFFAQFTEDCDRKGTNLSDFFRKRIVDALVYGSSFHILDFPRTSVFAETRAEEDAAGTARAYLLECSPEAVINWSTDANGSYEWVVLRNSYLRGDVETRSWAEETRWVYYDRTHYRVFTTRGDRQEIVELYSGLHGMAKQERVPLFEMKVPEGLWLMNRAGLLQLEHFNKSNALAWALTMGLFAQPVIFSERDFKQMVGESYYIQLGKEDRFGWTEPEGKVYQIAADNLTRLKDEIYRVCYLLAQAGAVTSGGNSQSGLSKLRDFAVAQEVLRAFGDAVKDGMKRVLRAVAEAREDELVIDVSGLDDFDISDFSDDLANANTLLQLGIPSPTLKRQIFKRLAYKYLCDVRQEVKDQISQEIDENLKA